MDRQLIEILLAIHNLYGMNKYHICNGEHIRGLSKLGCIHVSCRNCVLWTSSNQEPRYINQLAQL